MSIKDHSTTGGRLLTERIANLAHITLTDSEKDDHAASFVDILKMFEKMDECDTENIQLSDNIVMGEDNLREDIPQDVSVVDYLSENNPNFIDGHFHVPTVIESKT